MELARLSAGMIIWSTMEEIQDHIMRTVTIALLGRHNGDAKKAAETLKCRQIKLIEYLNAKPIVEQSGPTMVAFDDSDIPTSMEEIELWIRVQTIQAAQALLALLRPKESIDPELVRPAARLLNMEEYNLRRDLARR